MPQHGLENSANKNKSELQISIHDLDDIQNCAATKSSLCKDANGVERRTGIVCGVQYSTQGSVLPTKEHSDERRQNIECPPVPLSKSSAEPARPTHSSSLNSASTKNSAQEYLSDKISTHDNEQPDTEHRSSKWPSPQPSACFVVPSLLTSPCIDDNVWREIDRFEKKKREVEITDEAISRASKLMASIGLNSVLLASTSPQISPSPPFEEKNNGFETNFNSEVVLVPALSNTTSKILSKNATIEVFQQIRLNEFFQQSYSISSNCFHHSKAGERSGFLTAPKQESLASVLSRSMRAENEVKFVE